MYIHVCGFYYSLLTQEIIVSRAYSLLEEAAFTHNYTKAQELVALSYLVSF